MMTTACYWLGGLLAVAAGIAQGADAAAPVPIVLLVLAVLAVFAGLRLKRG
jgi:hypothetical protein